MQGLPSPRSASKSMALRSLPPSFAVGRRSAHVSDKTIEQVGNCFACPRISHRDPNAVDVLQSWSYAHELIAVGVRRAKTATILPEPRPMLRSIIQSRPLLKGAWARGTPRSSTSCLDAHNRQADDPVDDGLWTRCALVLQARRPADSGRDRRRES